MTRGARVLPRSKGHDYLEYGIVEFQWVTTIKMRLPWDFKPFDAGAPNLGLTRFIGALNRTRVLPCT